MNQLPTTTIYAILLALSLSRCDYTVQYREVPFAVEQYFKKLPAWEQPKKVQLDWKHRRVYWLNRKGEIYAIHADGTQVDLINQGIGAKLGITFIEDFTLNSQENILYFTDLMDISSGLSAIKISDLQGKNIKTLTTFPQETPYAISWDNATRQLFYLTRQPEKMVYQLKAMGESIPLASAKHQLKNIPALLDELPPTPVQAVAEQSALLF